MTTRVGEPLQHEAGPSPYFEGWCCICAQRYGSVDDWTAHRGTHPPGTRPVVRMHYDTRRAEREAWNQATRVDRR